MALRPDRNYTNGTDISFFMNETGEKGEVLVFSAGGSGASMDDPTAVVTTPNAVQGSGQRVAGVLLNDMVNLDLTRQHINWHKDEMQIGGKVTLLRQGTIVTNVVDTGSAGAPTIGAPAYLGRGAITAGGTEQGWLSATAVADNTLGNLVVAANVPTGTTVNSALYEVGTFLSIRDADGFAKVHVSL